MFVPYCLSKGKTCNIYKLVEELPHNHRLREPLFLYALCIGKTDRLSKALSGYPEHFIFHDLIRNYSWDDVLQLFYNNDMTLNQDYHKVYHSYVSERDAFYIDIKTKTLMHRQIRELQETKCISNYRLYTDLELNPSNVNAFLKKVEMGRVSMAVAEKMWDYLEGKQMPANLP